MAQTYTPDDTNNPTTYTEPDDGDAEDVASVLAFLEGLADGLAYTKRGNVPSGNLDRVVLFRQPYIKQLSSDFTLSEIPSAILIYSAAVTPTAQPCIASRSQTSSGDGWIMEMDLPHGAIIVSAFVQSIGRGVATTPTGLAKYKIVRYDHGGSEDDLTALTNDAHTYGGGGNWLTAIATTTLTGSATQLNRTVDNENYTYGLEVTNPYHASGSAMALTHLIVRITPGGLSL